MQTDFHQKLKMIIILKHIKNEIYIQKFIDKKTILFGTNYKINLKDLKDKKI